MATTRTTSVDLRPFTKEDWYGLAGAERFSVGTVWGGVATTEPLVWYGNVHDVFQGEPSGDPDLDRQEGLEIIVDAAGVAFLFCDKDGDHAMQFQLPAPRATSDFGRALVRGIVAECPAQINDLEQYGFERIL